MPSTASPYGLRPTWHPSGTIRPQQGQIADDYNTAIYQFAPVKIGTDGTIQLAASGERAVGVFQGVEYIDDATGRPVYTNRWVASTSIKSNTIAVAYYTRDPQIVYSVQSDAAIALADMGSQLDWGTASLGNATTGLSQVVALASTLTSSASAGLRIIGLDNQIDNAWGDTYTDILVQFSEHQDVADRVAY